MDVAVVDRFVAILTLLCIAGIAGVVALHVAAARSDAAARLRDGVADLVGGSALWLAWLVAAGSMVGSLYYSEVVGYAPCSLCWYQRIAMYPLVVLFAIAAWRRDRTVRRYAVPLVVVGAALALYQHALGYFPDAEVLGCSIDVSCTERYIWEFGFVDFPLMSFVAFAAIATLLRFFLPTDEEGA
jgi:disulfide bond formation protein DsbB